MTILFKHRNGRETRAETFSDTITSDALRRLCNDIFEWPSDNHEIHKERYEPMEE